jgi:hypothetical protein
MNSTFNTPFLSQKAVAISFVAGREGMFKLFRLVWWMCLLPLIWLLFGFNIHKWNSSFNTCCSYDVIEKLIAIFVLSLWEKPTKAEAIL